MSKEKPYRSLDHTADLGVEAWGKSQEELIANTSLALVDTMVDVETIIPKREVEWSIHAENPEALLVNHLQEILFRLDAEGMVFSEFKISHRGLNAIKCLAHGEPLDRERHHFKTELKAVTYHQLKFEEIDGVWRAQVIFDV